MKKFLLLCFFTGFAQILLAHPFGFTVNNLIYNKHQLTFSARILYDDFRSEFQRNAHVKGKNYVKNGFDEADKTDLQNYIRNNLHVYVDNRELSHKSVRFSFELHEEDVYIFIVEVSYKVKIKKGSLIRIQDNVLLQTIQGQTNMVNVFLNGPNSSPSHGVITLDKDHPASEFVNE